jgi:small-conductance mechanosensitive channel
MENFSDLGKLIESFGAGAITKLLSSIAIIIILWFIRYLILRVVRKRVIDIKLKYKWRKYITYIFVPIGVYLVANVWFEEFQSISTYLGLLSAGVAIALREPLVNLAGWLFIIWRHPFSVGDRIQIGNNFGDVIDQRIFQFTIMEIGNWVDAEQYTGRMVHIPNSKVFTDVQANYSDGFNFIWNEIPILVTFESDWQKAKKILTDIAIIHGREYAENAESEVQKSAIEFMIYEAEYIPTVYSSVKDSGVELTIRYTTPLRKRRVTEQTIWEDVLKEFSKHNDIDFAYPTTRFYSNYKEGKSGTKPE